MIPKDPPRPCDICDEMNDMLFCIECCRGMAATLAGQNGGRIGGRRRAEKLSPERRSEIARTAAMARWHREVKP